MMDLAHNLIIQTDVSSRLRALFKSSILIIFNMISSLKTIDESLFIDSHSIKLGITVSFSIGIHLSAKYLLKKLAFNFKSGSNLLFINNGGIKGTFLPL